MSHNSVSFIYAITAVKERTITMHKPQIIKHISHPLDYTIIDIKWIPCTENLVVIGARPKGTGVFEIYRARLGKRKLKLLKKVEKSTPSTCGSFGASCLKHSHLAVGDFSGRLKIIDLERPGIPKYNGKARSIINSIDAINGYCGTPEIVTGSRDGSVMVWDIRRGYNPVIIMKSGGEKLRQSTDCWAVAFGDTFGAVERTVAAGFDNGDLKLFDLRKLTTRWETTEKQGVVSIEFDRKVYPMNKMAATTLEGGLNVYDVRTQHPEKGFASVVERNATKSTLWGIKHFPQNRDVFVTCEGTGAVRLWEYEYPYKRSKDADDGHSIGVAGDIHMLNATTLSQEPVHCFDWSADIAGLAVCGSFDQTVRVLITTNINPYSCT